MVVNTELDAIWIAQGAAREITHENKALVDLVK